MKFDFLNNEGEKLSGRLEIPSGTPVASVLFAHCFTCSKDVIAAHSISKALAEQGFAVLRFDFTGLGNSKVILPIQIFLRMLKICWPLSEH